MEKGVGELCMAKFNSAMTNLSRPLRSYGKGSTPRAWDAMRQLVAGHAVPTRSFLGVPLMSSLLSLHPSGVEAGGEPLSPEAQDLLGECPRDMFGPIPRRSPACWRRSSERLSQASLDNPVYCFAPPGSRGLYETHCTWRLLETSGPIGHVPFHCHDVGAVHQAPPNSLARAWRPPGSSPARAQSRNRRE